ncbi:fumarylacetoacetate hydrolase family protein [Maricurvus nonylphenolicus]|uniref:fumarylacetoacetate hydrolase family protein n=1 Tax=Maricurvus nonylphenolicus TaxID=1008307 RepID=UPI0036F1A1A0
MGFRLVNVEGRAALVLGEYYYDLEEASRGALSSDPMDAVTSPLELSNISAELKGKQPTGRLEEVELGAPVPRPRNCYAIGLNYRNHAVEANMDIPEVPMVFTKHTNSITGPTADIEMRSDYIDYEAELVAVIGRGGKDIAVENAWDHVAGLCVGQDISDRTVQLTSKPPQFNLGKSFDTFGPLGPVLVSPEELDDPGSLHIKCEVNGEVRQSDNTNDLIFGIPEIIAYLSEIVTLSPGDLIFTGTPGGVAVVSGNFLRDGDVITTSIEGLGVLTNRCVRVSDHSRAKIIPDVYSAMLNAAKAAEK